ncbi:MAG: hypothetical protein ACHQ01_09660 [Candidatus Limnocylindrales bacterium]
MFWSRTSREARRQDVLDELLELDPSQRQARLELAVAAGHVRANELEETLRLVRRLDALRVMTFKPSSELASGEALPEAVLALAAPKPAAAPKVRKARVPVARATRPVAPDYAIIRVVADQEPGRSLPESWAVPIEVVLAASQLIDRDLAARRFRTGSFSSRQRRLRLLAVGGRSYSEAASLPDGTPDHHARDDGAEPSRPDISWLRR